MIENEKQEPFQFVFGSDVQDAFSPHTFKKHGTWFSFV